MMAGGNNFSVPDGQVYHFFSVGCCGVLFCLLYDFPNQLFTLPGPSVSKCWLFLDSSPVACSGAPPGEGFCCTVFWRGCLASLGFLLILIPPRGESSLEPLEAEVPLL